MQAPRDDIRRDKKRMGTHGCVRVCTHVLIWYNLHVLHMSRRLKNLPQHILRDPRIKPTNIQRSLVRFGSCTTWAAAHRGGKVIAAESRSHSRWEWVIVLRDVERRWHVAPRAILISSLTWRRASNRWWRERGGACCRVRHSRDDGRRVREVLSSGKRRKVMWKANKLLLSDDQDCCENLAKRKLNAQRDKLVERLALLEGGTGAMQQSVKCVRRCSCS